MLSSENERRAVFFFQDGRLIRQFRYAEFEAMLDQMGGVSELANTRAQAVYANVDGQLNILSAVFFTLDIDARGFADSNWNLPLALLASQGGAGPDLGVGPIKLVTYSRCPVSWHRDQLWDPPLRADPDPFEQLVETVRENRLGLPLSAVSATEAGPQTYKADAVPVLRDTGEDTAYSGRSRIARRLWAVRRQYADRRLSHQQETAQIHSRYRAQLQRLEHTSADLQRQVAEEQRVSSQLKQSLDAQAEHFAKMRQLISSQISKIEDGERLGEQLGEEFNVKLDAATAELQEALERKDVELFYRDGEIKSLGEKISELGQQKQELQQELAGSDFLAQLDSAGISFVAHQPGAGEFRVPREDIPAYLQSPEAYAANYCYVDLQHYRDWLAHDRKPVCCEPGADGQVCGLPVHRIASPATFESGESDRCSQHKTSSMTLRQVIKGA